MHLDHLYLFLNKRRNIWNSSKSSDMLEPTDTSSTGERVNWLQVFSFYAQWWHNLVAWNSEYFHRGNWLTTQVNVFLQSQWLNVYRTPLKKPLSMFFEGAVTYIFRIKLFCCCCYCFFWKTNKLSPMQYTSAFEVLFLHSVSLFFNCFFFLFPHITFQQSFSPPSHHSPNKMSSLFLCS